jgi:predicted Zn-dependent peptidase
MIGIYAGTGEKEAEEISAVIAGEMAALAADANETEVARARAQMKSSLLMGLEKPGTRAEQIASQLFTYGRVVPVTELIAKLDAVDAAAVRRFGARIMSTASPAMAALGPIGKVETHARFADRFGAGAARRAAE